MSKDSGPIEACIKVSNREIVDGRIPRLISLKAMVPPRLLISVLYALW